MTAYEQEVKITEFIHELGIPAHLKGYYYLRKGISLALSDKTLLDSMIHRFYPILAEHFNTTPSRIERAMRHAIQMAWSRGNIDKLEEVFGYTVDPNKGKPTIGEFVSLAVDNLSFEFRKIDSSGGGQDSDSLVIPIINIDGVPLEHESVERIKALTKALYDTAAEYLSKTTEFIVKAGNYNG